VRKLKQYKGQVASEYEWKAGVVREQQAGFARDCNYPTQAKRRLEWATRQNVGPVFTITKTFNKQVINGKSVTKVTVTKH
jgi:hypothetical protein